MNKKVKKELGEGENVQKSLEMTKLLSLQQRLTVFQQQNEWDYHKDKKMTADLSEVPGIFECCHI